MGHPNGVFTLSNPPKKGSRVTMTQILIVDDDEMLRASIADLLINAGYSIHEADNGQAALDFLHDYRDIEVVLSDMKMPTMDGPTLLNTLRLEHPDIAVIMLTGYGTVESAVQALREGAINYLLKPTNKRQLLDAVREALDWRAARTQKQQLVAQVVSSLHALGMTDSKLEDTLSLNIQTETPLRAQERFLQVRDLMIDHHRLTAMFKGKPLELTPTEFEILYCLVQAAGRVVTFEDIAHRIQGVRLSRDEARTLLSTHLSNLRGKLTKAGAEEYVQNSRGSGYFIDI